MQPSRQRFSHRHLLALGTFLVPLGVLAVLGQSELQRSGAEAQAAIDSAAQEFLRSAGQAVEQRFERMLPPLWDASQNMLAERGPVRTTLALRQQGFTALRDIILLDQDDVVWPDRAPPGLSLPFIRDAGQRNPDTISGALDAAGLLLDLGKREKAVDLLSHLLVQVEAAKPPERSARRLDLEVSELRARFRLATAHMAMGAIPAARSEFERVLHLVNTNSRNLDGDSRAIGLAAESALAQLGSTADRLKLLHAIAEGDRSGLADGLLSALARRLAATIGDEDMARPEVDTLLREERQRTETRAFAADYDFVFKYGLRLRRGRQTNADELVGDHEERLIASLSGTSSLLSVRPATDQERQRLKQQPGQVGLHLDLGEMLAPVLQPFDGSDGTFVLAVLDPDDVAIVPAPSGVPTDFIPPSRETNGLTLRAYPADATKLIAETEAAAWTRTLLVLALFVTALGGALWSWRSVSREAELAALKIDLVSRVSHELKTPLALIRMYGETLSMGRARDNQQTLQFGGIIARESERLTFLIQRILDFSQQQAGTLQYSPQVKDLGALLRSVCDAYTPHLEARGAILVETLPPGIFAPCDGNALESAIVNLLENAAKYGIEGDQEHEVELELATEGSMVVIEVRDRGRGIPPDELSRVFEGFYRASNAGEVRGAGLGLSLVHHFARAHDGDITARAREGGGTIFRLTLPRASAPLPTAATTASSVASARTAANPAPRP